jgi:hypothetical protein
MVSPTAGWNGCIENVPGVRIGGEYRLLRIYGNPSLSMSEGFEFHDSVYFCKEGVVLASSHILSRVYTGAALANED